MFYNQKDIPPKKNVENYVISSIEDKYISNLLGKKLQIILYGPPGTGKTYNTKKIAIKLLK